MAFERPALTEGEPACYERAWLEMREAAFRLLEESDVDRALMLAAEGIRLAEEAKEPDLEVLGRSIQGLALVASGSIPEGMRCLDEANTAVISGEITDLVIIGVTSCYLISACERVRDYERAAEWCERLKAGVNDSSDLQWFTRNIMAQTLTNGYCSIPTVAGSCPHPNACLNCAHFRTDATFLEVHRAELRETEQIIGKAEANGWTRQIEMNARKRTSLINIVYALEASHA